VNNLDYKDFGLFAGDNLWIKQDIADCCDGNFSLRQRHSPRMAAPLRLT
jgi:hypothetical protein